MGLKHPRYLNKKTPCTAKDSGMDKAKERGKPIGGSFHHIQFLVYSMPLLHLLGMVYGMGFTSLTWWFSQSSDIFWFNFVGRTRYGYHQPGILFSLKSSLIIFPHPKVVGNFSRSEKNWSSRAWMGRMGLLLKKTLAYSYGHLSVISTYNPIYRMYNPIYNQL